MTISKRAAVGAAWHMAWRSAAVAAIACAVHGATQAQVKYFDHVPTPEEIQQALMPAAAQSTTAAAHSSVQNKTPGIKMRGIEWSMATPSPAGSAASAPAAAETAGNALAFPVNFDLGAARVNRGSMPYIDAIATALERNPKLRVAVEGHTDAAGNARSNLMLSWERAFSVFRLLVDKYGIDPARIQPAGKGANEPLLPSDPLNGVNRRVQFRVMG